MPQDAGVGAVASPAREGANAEQAQAWNGESGMHWVHYRDRHDAQLRAFTPHLFEAADIRPRTQVLDVGCGCGVTTLHAAAAAGEGHARGIDLSAPMLAEARRLAALEGLDNASFVEGDAQVHPFEPESFDLVISRFGMMFFADAQAAFANIARGLRPGGALVFLCWQRQELNELFTFTRQAISPFLTPPPLVDSAQPGPFALADPARVEQLLTAAGFDAVEIAGIAEPVWVGTDADDVVSYQLTTPTNRSLFASADEDARERALSAWRDALREREAPQGIELRGAAWLVTARRP
jgi:SAM-dependent methyltransferase